jgi:hypothetical protein
LALDLRSRANIEFSAFNPVDRLPGKRRRSIQQVQSDECRLAAYFFFVSTAFRISSILWLRADMSVSVSA